MDFETASSTLPVMTDDLQATIKAAASAVFELLTIEQREQCADEIFDFLPDRSRKLIAAAASAANAEQVTAVNEIDSVITVNLFTQLAIEFSNHVMRQNQLMRLYKGSDGSIKLRKEASDIFDRLTEQELFNLFQSKTSKGIFINTLAHFADQIAHEHMRDEIEGLRCELEQVCKEKEQVEGELKGLQQGTENRIEQIADLTVLVEEHAKDRIDLQERYSNAVKDNVSLKVHIQQLEEALARNTGHAEALMERYLNSNDALQIAVQRLCEKPDKACDTVARKQNT